MNTSGEHIRLVGSQKAINRGPFLDNDTTNTTNKSHTTNQKDTHNKARQTKYKVHRT